jgi:hypothetical protein
MENTRGLLYPAFHKFYNALSNLENFEKGKDFFDNINSLDNFFSEFRNITFVLQKSLAHTDFMSKYDEIRNKYLVNEVGRWFVDKRNEVLKQSPFDLEKRILITIYSNQAPLILPELTYTIDNDVVISSIINNLRVTFKNLEKIEVIFSVEFSFFEKGKNTELYENLILGIDQMKLFLSEMKNSVNENCKLTNELEKKIENLNFYRVPKDMLFIDDYIFYSNKGIFDKASRIALLMGDKQNRIPVDRLNITYPNGNLFDKFELMHLVIYQMQKTILPTCLILYDDKTFELLTFGCSIKTTVYRKFHEISKRIEKDKLVSVLFVNEMYVYDEKEVSGMNSYQRIKHAKREMLAFYEIDKNLNMKSRMYNISLIDDYKYIASVMYNNNGQKELPYFMNSVIQKFSELKSATS